MTENQMAIVNIFKDFDPNANLDTKIKDLKLDSLDVLDALMQIQEKFGIDIPVTQLIFIKDIRSVLGHIENANSRKT